MPSFWDKLVSAGKQLMLKMFRRPFAFPLVAAAAMAQPVVLRPTMLLDGHGHVLRNQQITVENGRITRIAFAKD